MGAKFSSDFEGRNHPSSVTTINDLPSQVRCAILHQLSLSDTLSARLVSRQWYIDVSYRSKMFGTLDNRTTDDDPLTLKEDREFDCHYCRILSLTDGETTLVEGLFPKPENIRLLIIGEVTVDHLLTLLKYFPCLERLKLCTNKILSVDKTKNELWHQKDSCLLPKTSSMGDFVQSRILTKISIRGPCGVSVDKLMCPARKVFRRFVQSKFPALKTFELIDLECNQYDEPSFTILLLVFIGNHRSTLENLSIKMTSVPATTPDESYKCQLLSVGLPEELLIPDEAIEETKLAKLSIDPLASGIGGIHWLHLMQEQNSLEQLDGKFLAAPFSLYRSVINRNFKTLTSINLSQLSLCEPSDPDPTNIRPLRLSLFVKCPILKRLTLARFEHDPATRETSCPSEITSMSSLPVSLEFLSISGFRLLQTEIMEMTKTLTNLKSLTLVNCGRSTNCGVNVSLLQTFVDESILKLDHVCVKPLNLFTGGDVEKFEQISRLVTSSGLPFDSLFLKERKIEWRLDSRRRHSTTVPPSSSSSFGGQRSLDPRAGWLMFSFNNIKTRIGRSFMNTMKDIFK